MNINKILKFYLVLTLSIGSMALLGYSPNSKHPLKEFTESSFYNQKLFTSVLPIENSRNVLSSVNTGDYTVNFTLSSDPEKRFANPGEKNIEIMKISFKSPDGDIVLKSLNFKISALDQSKVRNVYLFEGETKIASASIGDGYAKFSNISYETVANKEAVLSVRMDLSKKTQVGDRVRLDIEKSEDVEIIVDDKTYDLRKYYPIQGHYLSVAKIRPTAKSEALAAK